MDYLLQNPMFLCNQGSYMDSCNLVHQANTHIHHLLNDLDVASLVAVDDEYAQALFGRHDTLLTGRAQPPSPGGCVLGNM